MAGIPTEKILKNTAANASAQAIVMLVGFIALPLLIKGFGVAAYGVYVIAVSISSYAYLFDFGLGLTLVRLVAESKARNDQDTFGKTIASTLALYLVLATLIAVIMGGIGWFSDILFAVDSGEAYTLRLLLFVGAITQFIYWPASLLKDSLNGLQRYDLTAITTILTAVIDVGGIVFVLVTGQGPLVLILIRFAGQILTGFINLVLFIQVAPPLRHHFKLSRSQIRSMLADGRSVFTLQMAGFLGRQQADKLILGVVLGTTSVTIYDIAAKFNSLISTFTSLTTSAVTPVVAELNACEDHQSVRALLFKGSRFITALVTPLTVVLLVIMAPFLRIWMGPNFSQATPVVILLLFSQIFIPLYQMGDPILLGKNRLKRWARGAVVLGVINIVVSLVAALSFGTIGVAVGTLVAGILEIPWYISMAGSEAEVSIKDWMRFTLLPAYPLLLVPLALAYIGLLTPLATSLGGLIVVCALAVCIYWLLFFLIGLNKSDRSGLFSLLPLHKKEVA